MEELKIKLDDKKRSEKTLKTYQQDMKSLSKLFSNDKWYLNVENVVETLKKNYSSKHTIKNKLAVISLFIKGLDEFPEKVNIRTKYVREIKILDFDIAKENAKHIKTDKQKENWITKDDWKKMLDHHRPDVNNDDMDINQIRNYIVLAIYSQVALRNDLVDLIILPNDKYDMYKKDNLINNVLLFDEENETCKLILRQYKTAKIYGDNHIELNDVDDLALFTALFYHTKYGKWQKDILYLLSKINGEPISTQAFCKYFKDLGKCINKELSTTIIRHCAVSEIYDIGMLKKVAKRMGHSIHEALSVYAKI